MLKIIPEKKEIAIKIQEAAKLQASICVENGINSQECEDAKEAYKKTFEELNKQLDA